MSKTETRPAQPETGARRKGYKVPFGTHIGRGSETEKLYRLEERRDEAIRNATKELGRLLSSASERYDLYRDALPEALLGVLDAHDSSAAMLAAYNYLKRKQLGLGQFQSRTVPPAKCTRCTEQFVPGDHVEMVEVGGGFVWRHVEDCVDLTEVRRAEKQMERFGKRCPYCLGAQVSSDNSTPINHRCLGCSARFSEEQAIKPPQGGWAEVPGRSTNGL